MPKVIISDQVDDRVFAQVCEQIGAQRAEHRLFSNTPPLTGYRVSSATETFFVDDQYGRVYRLPEGVFMCLVDTKHPNEYLFDASKFRARLLARLLALHNAEQIPELAIVLAR